MDGTRREGEAYEDVPPEVVARVLAGMAYLDTTDGPAWSGLIDLAVLDLGCPTFCVLGQLGRRRAPLNPDRAEYFGERRARGLERNDAARLGFDAHVGLELGPAVHQQGRLTRAWSRAIVWRRAEASAWRYRCTGRTAAAEVACTFATDDVEAANAHFETLDHDVEDTAREVAR